MGGFLNYFSGNQKSNIVNDESIKQFVENKTASGEYKNIDGRKSKDRKNGIKRVLNKILGDGKQTTFEMTKDDMEDLYTNLLLIKDIEVVSDNIKLVKDPKNQRRGSVTSLDSLGKFGELE